MARSHGVLRGNVYDLGTERYRDIIEDDVSRTF